MARLLAILVVTTTCAFAHADGSGSDAPQTPKKAPLQPPEEEPVAPTGLIIAGVALALFGVVFWLGKRKTKPRVPAPRDRVDHRIPSVAARPADFHAMPNEPLAVAALGVGTYKPDARQLIADLPTPGKPPGSPAGAYPDAASQGKLGEQLKGLIDVELDAPKPAPDLSLDPGAGDFGPALELADRPKTPSKAPPGLTLDLADAVDFDLPLEPPAIAAPLPPRPRRPSALGGLPARSGNTAPPPSRPAALLDDLPMPPSKTSLDFGALDDLGLQQPVAMPAPVAGHYELAPSQAAPVKKAASKAVSVSEFALDDLPVRPAAPAIELPKVNAASVADLALDEEDVPVHRIPARTSSNRKVPSVADFALDDHALELSAEPVSQAMPKTHAMVRAVTPVATSELDDILAPAGSPPPAATGGVLAGRYRRGAALGGGPLGHLFRGRDETGRRDVMIEEVARDVTLPVAAAALAQVTHANLVTFYDHVIEGSRGYLITELVEGKTLAYQLAERGAHSALEAIGIVDQVCAGLAAAHTRGVFHRCIRPACIAIAGRTVKLAGFAWSPSLRALAYTAPELAGGATPDARADLYSIGITLAELLSGTAPVPGKLELPADVPRTLVQLVRKLVSREPTIRPASAKAVRDAFSAIF